MIHMRDIRRLILPGRRHHGRNWREEDPAWAKIHDEHLREHNSCAARSAQCRGHLTPHHIKPRWLFPELYYERTNLITLCKWHHQHIGHGGNWCAWIPDVRRRAEECRILGWTTPELLSRCRKERSFVVEGAAAPGGGQFPQLPALVVPPGGATAGWWARLKRGVLGTVLLAILPLPLVGCRGGPGVRVSVALTPLPVVTIQVGGGDLEGTGIPQSSESPTPGPLARPEDGEPGS